MFLGGWSDSTACVIFFSKYPWCTVLLQPLCLQPQHLPQVFPLQPQQPIRFAFLPLPPPQPWLFFFLWHLMILMCFIKKCMSGAQDSSLIFASFSQHFLFRKSLRGSLFICVHWNAACPYLHWSVWFFFFTSIHATDFFLPLVFPSHTDSSYICRPPD